MAVKAAEYRLLDGFQDLSFVQTRVAGDSAKRNAQVSIAPAFTSGLH